MIGLLGLFPVVLLVVAVVPNVGLANAGLVADNIVICINGGQ